MNRIVPGSLNGVEWLEPWRPVDAKLRETAERELGRELVRGHPLHGRECRCVAAGDVDDVLFIVDGEALAIVHLTWSRERDPRWPSTRLLPDVQAFVAEMRRDHAELDE